MSNTKRITLFDKVNAKRDHYNKSYVANTLVEVFIEGTDKCVFRGKNKCVIAGAGLTARKLFQTTSSEISPTYDTALGLQSPTNAKFQPIDGVTIAEDSNLYSALIEQSTKVYLFAVGTDGCGTDAASVYSVPYISRIEPTKHLIPFQYRPTSNDLTKDERTKYFGKRIIDDYAAYYFKAFDNNPEFKQVYNNGTAVTELLYDSYDNAVKNSVDLDSVYDSNTIEEAETYVKLQLSISSGNNPDCRSWFTSNGSSINSSNARINTISLISAYPVIGTDPANTSLGDVTYYKNLRPVTKLNIPNESLIDVTKGLVINYYIYF